MNAIMYGSAVPTTATSRIAVKGVATRALLAFLNHVKVRPFYARVVKDNIASIRVLEKCGFTICGEGKGFSNARGAEVEEYILKLC